MWETPCYYWDLQALNPATLLPVGEGGPSHDCKGILEEAYDSRPDLRDQPIPDPDWVLYTNGSSLVKQERWLSGCAIVMEETIVEASSLPSHCSAQRVKLYALIWALLLSEGRKTNIYTDSRYAFATLHVYGALYKEGSLLTANRKDIKSKEEILTLLDAVWEPEMVAAMHCWGHKKEDTPQAWGNRQEDKASKHEAEKFGAAGGGSIRTFVLSKMPELTFDFPTVYPSPRPAGWSRKGHQKWKRSMLPLNINKNLQVYS